MRGRGATRQSAWIVRIVIATAVVIFAADVVAAQAIEPTDAAELNPIGVLEGAAESVPGVEGGLSASLNILLLLTVLSIAPAILILCTCFTRIVIVLGLLRQALGTQGLPPSQVIVGLSLFITFAVMAPTFNRIYQEGVRPYADGEITDYREAWDRSKQPLRDFMFAQIEATGNWSGVYMMLNYRGIDTSDPSELTRSDVDMLSLVPAYILSELKVAFLMGFRIYLPFLVIDIVIASMLISMGMLMLPPVLISLPFKLLLFVLVDGWQLVVGSLMASVASPDVMQTASNVMINGP
jgi:flagellar biosynthetic protein FliP